MEAILENIQVAIAAMTWQEIGATIFGIIYVILAAREHIWCWFFGLIGVALSLWVYIDIKLYSDASLQVFYIIMSVYGWMTWSKTKANKDKLEINILPQQTHLYIIGGGAILAFLLGLFWQQFGAALPYIDAFTTSFSIIATFMVAKKILENWLYWMVIDFACIFIYWNRELYLFSFLFLIYCIIAMVGYLNWRKTYKAALLS